MALPPPDHPCWLRLAHGALAHLSTHNLAAQLLTKRLERSKEPADQKARQIHAFFAKWQVSLADEISQITRL